jgi:hypothetical protein
MMDYGAHAEVTDEGSSKRPQGRPTNIGHFHDKEDPEHFILVIFQPTLGSCPIPKAFVPWFGNIPFMITQVTNMMQLDRKDQA